MIEFLHGKLVSQELGDWRRDHGVKSGRNSVFLDAMSLLLVEIPSPRLCESFVADIAFERFLACNRKR